MLTLQSITSVMAKGTNETIQAVVKSITWYHRKIDDITHHLLPNTTANVVASLIKSLPFAASFAVVFVPVKITAVIIGLKITAVIISCAWMVWGEMAYKEGLLNEKQKSVYNNAMAINWVVLGLDECIKEASSGHPIGAFLVAALCGSIAAYRFYKMYEIESSSDTPSFVGVSERKSNQAVSA